MRSLLQKPCKSLPSQPLTGLLTGIEPKNVGKHLISQSNQLCNIVLQRMDHQNRRLNQHQYNQKVLRYWAKWDGMLERGWVHKVREELMPSHRSSTLKVLVLVHRVGS